ncbi:hypothetical protein BHU72_02290 [Desulfuribacillus stibiiarsenatis]|uniref:HD-GYP domain-containing protein n=1 Tax=Desulfuribacillus stibiiarsenatis TaxID=1390249 RepID=A0A1E5L666_9FIRM|nr:HD domain-containing phosphohydrolase [Desulfuribacillus stibiiarsenatis]OEH85647.1 hypothetical protein BHU72_02290 [Desulfuribacillus stibiiarsenatis]
MIGCEDTGTFTLKLKLAEIIDAFSLALDLAEEKQLGHARRTASIALLIAMHYGVKGYELNNIYYTAMLHDIGLSEPLGTITATEQASVVRGHAISGSKIVANIPYLENISPFVKYHHERWDGKGEPEGLRGKLIPLVSRIINVADSIEMFVNTKGRDTYSLQNYLQAEAGRRYDPELCKIAYELVQYNEFYETMSHPIALLEDLRPQDQVDVDNAGLLLIGNGLAQVVDNKSSYTANHSIEVAQFSVELGRHLGFKGERLHKLEVAALLHDVGKLGIPTKILHKTSGLTEAEFQQITFHPYYTEIILSQVKGFSEICSWASLHHEKLDGTGYHRQYVAEQIPIEARLIAIADVFQALKADRPYRAGLPYEKIMIIMQEMADKLHLDPEFYAEFTSIAPSLMENNSVKNTYSL